MHGFARALVVLLVVTASSGMRPLKAEPNVPAPRHGELARAIYFDENSTTLRPDAIPYLRDWAAYLTLRDLDSTLRLQGHSDRRGTRAYNDALAEQRALAVRGALIALGVDAERLEVESAGARSPQAFGQTEFAWSRNRRVELELDK